jgi:drug/metabolite transporter (DMT)-like permease
MNAPEPVSILSPRVFIPFLIVTMIWGATWIVIKDQLGVVPPSWSVTYRFLVAGTVMFIVALVTRVPIAIGKRGLLFAAIFGIAQFVFNFNFVYRAEHYVTSGLVAVVFALLFVPNALMSKAFLGQSISRPFYIGSALSIIGIILLFVNEARGDDRDIYATLTGIGFTLAGVMSASIANVMQATQRARTLPMASILAWGMLFGTIVNAAFAWITVGPPVVDMRINYFLGIAYLGVIGSALAFTLYFGMIRAIGPAKAAYSSVTIPIVAMIISTFAEGYHWTPLAVAGCVSALGGLVVAFSARKPAT